MTTWDPVQYEVFADHRLRPAHELIDRIPARRAPRTVWDLGCGTGTPTALLKARWPDATVTGLDSSEEMLDTARRDDRIAWVSGDIETWVPPEPVDLVFSNAALHWIDDHPGLFGRIIETLAPGGFLALQMPRNHTEPSHVRLFEIARSARWAPRVGHLVRDVPVLEPAEYHRLLSPVVEHLDIWETVYHQALVGPDAVAEWTRGSVARPYLKALGDDAAEFFSEYASALRRDYPASSDGTVLFPFRRLFVVAGT